MLATSVHVTTNKSTFHSSYASAFFFQSASNRHLHQGRIDFMGEERRKSNKVPAHTSCQVTTVLIVYVKNTASLGIHFPRFGLKFSECMCESDSKNTVLLHDGLVRNTQTEEIHSNCCFRLLYSFRFDRFPRPRCFGRDGLLHVKSFVFLCVRGQRIQSRPVRLADVLQVAFP